MTRPSPLSQPAALFSLLAACAAGTLTSWIDEPWAQALSVSLLLAAALHAYIARRGGPLRLPDPAVLCLLAIPLCGALQLLTGLSVYAHATLQSLVYWSSLAAAFWIALGFFQSTSARQLMLHTLGILSSLLAWAVLLQPYAGRMGVDSIVSVAADAYAGSFSNRNIYSCFAELALPVLLWLAFSNPRMRWFWLANAATLVASVVNTGSRGGTILILLECAACGAWMIRGEKLYWKLAFGAALVTILVAGSLGDGGFALRIQYSDPLVHRREIAQSGIAMLAEHPLSGFGLGAFSAAYPAYALFDNGRFVNLAHNDWLQLAVEGGLPLFGFFAAFVYLTLTNIRQSSWALGIPFVLTHALVDFPLHRIGVAAWFMLLAAALRANPSRSSTVEPKRTRRRAPVLVTQPSPRDLPSPVLLSAESSDRSSTTTTR